MRKYNFPVSFKSALGNVFCRVVLDERFTPRQLINDYPKNITARYLNDVIGKGAVIATYRQAEGNAIDIVISATTLVSDVDRAVTLNLLDFGQDFDSPRSTTIKEVVFFVDAPGAASVDNLLETLEAANVEAGIFMTARLAEFPPTDEYLAKSWPQDWVEDQKYDWPGYHFFRFTLVYAKELASSDRDFAENLMNASHDVNMWDGYNPGLSAVDSVASGRAGISFEIDAEGSSIAYVVERAPCDPALSVKRLAEAIHERLGEWPQRWQIGLEPED